jgi:glycosyltransferase involved in cell wall biosynthesis
MKILQILPLLDSYHCFLRELCEALEASGHEVLVLCRTQKGTLGVAGEPDPRCQHFPFPRGANPIDHLRAARELAKVINAWNPDLIHAHFSAAILTTALSRTFTRHPARRVCTFQGLLFPTLTGPKARLFKLAETRSARRFGHTWVLTPDDLHALQTALPPSARARIHQQHSPGFGCADRFLDTPRPAPDQRLARRAENDYTPEHTVFIYTGRLVAFKGFPLLVRAFLKAHRQNPALRLLVIGNPDPQHPTGLTPAEFQTFKTHPAIRWTGNQTDVLPWLDLADAFVFPATREGMPVGTMEALARGLPVLTNPVRGCKHLIHPGQNGLFFEANTPEAITRALLTLPEFPKSPPPEHLRRSHWNQETLAAYAKP